MASLTVKALPLAYRPTGQEDEAFDLPPGVERVRITLDDGTVLHLINDCGTLLIRSQGVPLKVTTYEDGARIRVL